MDFNDKKAEIIGFGALNLDKTFHVNEIACEDGESFIKKSEINPGGSAANTIIGLSRLNIPVSYIGKIANDEEGKILKNNLKSENVQTDNLIISKKGRSGKVLGFINKNGERTLYVDPGVNDEISFEEIDIKKIASCKIIHYSSFVGKSIDAQKELVKILPTSIILSFDPGHLYVKKGFESLKAILKRTNILLINEIELKILFENHFQKENNIDKNKDLNIRDLVIYLINEGIENIIVKRGKKGVYGINNKDEEVKIPAFNCEAIDTTGAGDSFNTGFLYSYLNGYSLEKSCLIGNWIASKCVEKIAIEGLPTIEDLKKFEKTLNI